VSASRTETSVLSALLSGEAPGAQIAMAQPSHAGPPLFAPPEGPQGDATAIQAAPHAGAPVHPPYGPPPPYEQPVGYPPSYPHGYPPAPALPGNYPMRPQEVHPYEVSGRNQGPFLPDIGPFPPGIGPFPPGAGAFDRGAHAFTAEIQVLDLDEIPDSYKIRRGQWLSPVRIALLALILAAAAAAVLYGIYGGGSEPAPTSVIEIVSSPPGAMVTIDGAGQAVRTPSKFVGVAGRKYDIALDLPRYQRWQRETSGGDEKLIARLDPVTVKLKVGSTPPDAEVFLNGAPAGRTPIELGGLDPLTTKVIELRHRCCKPVRRVLEWGDSELEKALDFPLER
jgi:hypothetical protein